MPQTLQFFTAQITLTDAQIKAIPTVAPAIVAAPGAGKVILPISIWYILDTTAGAYDAQGGILRAGYEGGIGITSALQLTGPFVTTRISLLGPLISSENQVGILEISLYAEDKGLELLDFDASGNYTGGNAANSLKVITNYTILEL